MSFSIDCAYCPAPGNTIMSFAPAPEQDQATFDAAWKAAMSDYSSIKCGGCGAQFGLEDDPSGSVQRKNISKPRIDSLLIGSGARTGGEAIFITGSALDVGALVVKFGGKPVLDLTHRTTTQARIVTPQGQYAINVDTIITPGFIVGEGVIGVTSGARGAVKSVLPFVVDSPTRAFDPNEEITGDASGARLRTTSTPYSGAVDVTVENEHGQRVAGGVVLNGFTYL